ncbi:MAG: hypothetical protein PHX00_10970 [Synergistaceae bacterium]|nr:hypothetical protein [Synergistaceae bacterium]
MDDNEFEDGGLGVIGDVIDRNYLVIGTFIGLVALVLNYSVGTLLSSNQLQLMNIGRYLQAHWAFFVGCALLFGVAYSFFCSIFLSPFLGYYVRLGYGVVLAMLGVVTACLFEKLAGRALFGAREHKLLLFLLIFLTDRILMIPILASALYWFAEHIFAIAVVIAILFFFFRI